jgi:DNA-binding transcriptional LysR family regulator
VADFLDQFPRIDIRLMLSDRNVHLVDDHVDMAVRIGRLTNSAMVATRIGTMRIVAAASPVLLARHGVPRAPEDLRDLPAVAVDGPMPKANWRFRPSSQAASIDVPLKPRLSVTTTETAVEAAVRGVGIVRLLHYQVVEAVEAGRLQLVLEGFEPEPAPVHLVHASRGQMPLKLRRFLDVAAPALRERLARLSRPEDKA